MRLPFLLDNRRLYLYSDRMAYLRILERDGRRYFYIIRSVREGKKVTPKILEYLGRDPEPARLRKAMEYWGVGKRRKRSEPGRAGGR
jgi:hypothetical protein